MMLMADTLLSIGGGVLMGIAAAGGWVARGWRGRLRHSWPPKFKVW